MEEIKIQFSRKNGVCKDFIDANVFAYGSEKEIVYKNVTPEYLSQVILGILQPCEVEED